MKPKSTNIVDVNFEDKYFSKNSSPNTEKPQDILSKRSEKK